VGDRVYRLVVRAFCAVFVLLGLRIEIRGAEHVPKAGPAVLACNHTSYLDFALVGFAASRRGRLVRFLAKASTFDNPLTGPLMRAMGHVPVDRARGAAAYRRAGRELARGEVVGIFPEATISRSWTLKPFKLGAATLAAAEGVPLVPVVVWGGHRVLTVDRRWSLRRHHPVTVLLGEPVDVPAGASVQEVDQQLRRRLDVLLDSAQRGYPDAPRDDADRWWLPRRLGGTAPTPHDAAVLDAASVAEADATAQRRRERRRGRSRRQARQAAARRSVGRLVRRRPAVAASPPRRG